MRVGSEAAATVTASRSAEAHMNAEPTRAKPASESEGRGEREEQERREGVEEQNGSEGISGNEAQGNVETPQSSERLNDVEAPEGTENRQQIDATNDGKSQRDTAPSKSILEHEGIDAIDWAEVHGLFEPGEKRKPDEVHNVPKQAKKRVGAATKIQRKRLRSRMMEQATSVEQPTLGPPKTERRLSLGLVLPPRPDRKGQRRAQVLAVADEPSESSKAATARQYLPDEVDDGTLPMTSVKIGETAKPVDEGQMSSPSGKGKGKMLGSPYQGDAMIEEPSNDPDADEVEATFASGDDDGGLLSTLADITPAPLTCPISTSDVTLSEPQHPSDVLSREMFGHRPKPRRRPDAVPAGPDSYVSYCRPH